MKIAGIYRERQFSNRAVAADRAILDKALFHLKQDLKSEVTIDLFQACDGADIFHLSEVDCILSMAQGEGILAQLQNLEHRGVRVVNSVVSIRNCYRQRLSEILGDGEFSYPAYSVMETGAGGPMQLPFKDGCWVKRGDFHAVADNDVQFIDDEATLTREMAAYQARGITHVICQENITGHIIKFYGVTDQFFSYRYMGMTGPDRYDLPEGLEPKDIDHSAIREQAVVAARKLGLVFFGGDCIIDSSGGLHFIDVNDWPSFRSCADEAAYAMSEYILRLFKP